MDDRTGNDSEVILEYVDSSVIKSALYDHAYNQLLVEMVSGNIYVYDSVPYSVADRWKSASSKGRYYNEYIKGKYTYVRS